MDTRQIGIGALIVSWGLLLAAGWAYVAHGGSPLWRPSLPAPVSAFSPQLPPTPAQPARTAPPVEEEINPVLPGLRWKDEAFQAFEKITGLQWGVGCTSAEARADLAAQRASGVPRTKWPRRICPYRAPAQEANARR